MFKQEFWECREGGGPQHELLDLFLSSQVPVLRHSTFTNRGDPVARTKGKHMKTK